VPNPFDLAGHVAVVTGGNSGIGRGMAAGLAEAGADVAIWARRQEQSEQVAAELRDAYGTNVVAVACDVTDPASVDEATAATLDQLGRIDSCFANAGVGGSRSAFVDMPLAEFHRVLSTNLEGAFLTLQAAARHMVERGDGGSLVGVSSLAGVEGTARNQHYAASKAGLIAMIRGCAVELARYGVRANAVLPGWIDTPMTEEAFAQPAFEQHVLRRVPQRRWGTPEDFAGVAVYLASPASAYHSGDEFVVDGGYRIF
jgi:NAD(P)-dependent dehydrogenase (short-subunit alcohol dehydrogenase family)